MLERDIERYLHTECKRHDLMCLKNITIKGFPDRTIIDTRGNVYFVELKRETGKLSPAQLNIIASLEVRGCNVYVLYGKKHVDEFIQKIVGGTPSCLITGCRV